MDGFHGDVSRSPDGAQWTDQMKIAAVSDTHGNFPNIPELLDQDIDLLLVVGDIAGGSHQTNAQYKSMGKFVKWVQDIDPKHCVITQGNHDYWKWDEVFKYRSHGKHRIHHLIDSSVDIEGLRIHGTPWSLPFLDWNWMKSEERLIPHWKNIHHDTDILINHGPALGMCDMPLQRVRGEYRYEHMGSKSLLDELWIRSIPRVLTGHIHSAAHGDVRLAPNHPTICSCVSILDEEYKYKYPPKIFEV
jgi:Icc-related predicted phosphoesterase